MGPLFQDFHKFTYLVVGKIQSLQSCWTEGIILCWL